MGLITDLFESAFRDYITDGVPATGPNKPAKVDIRAIGNAIETSIGTLSLGSVSVVKDTRAHLNADLAHPDGAVALTYADVTTANNDFSIKVGASGTGSWTLTTILHDAIAAAAAPFTAAAAASAVAAAASAASIAGLTGQIAIAQPSNIDALAALRFDLGSFTSGGGYTPGAAGVVVGVYVLDPLDVAARSAGQIVAVKVPVTAGAIASATIVQRNASHANIGSPVAMTIENGEAITRGVTLNSLAVEIVVVVTAGGAGATIQDVGVAVGEPATVSTDTNLIAERGAVEDAANANPFLMPQYYEINLAAGTLATFNSVDGGIAPLTFQGHLIAAYPFVQGQTYTLSFLSPNLPRASSIVPFLNESSIHVVNSWTANPPPQLRYLGNNLYACTFVATDTTYPVIGVGLRVDNISPLTTTVTLSDFKFVVGANLPATRTPPSTIAESARKTARNLLVANASRPLMADKTKIFMNGTSITKGFNGTGGTETNMGVQLASLLGGGYTVTNNAVRGAHSSGICARWNSTPANVTFTGGSIPAATTAVAVTFDCDFFSLFTLSDSEEPLNATVHTASGDVYGTFNATRVSGSITGMTFTRAVAGSLITVASAVPVTTDEGIAARGGINYLEIGRNDEFSPLLMPRDALPEWLMGFIDRHIDYMPLYKQLIVGLPMIALTDSDIAARKLANERYKQLLGPIPWFDPNAIPDAAGLAYMSTTFGWTPNSTDLTDMAAGNLPTTLRSATDSQLLHQSLNGNRFNAYGLRNLLRDTLKWL